MLMTVDNWQQAYPSMASKVQLLLRATAVVANESTITGGCLRMCAATPPPWHPRQAPGAPDIVRLPRRLRARRSAGLGMHLQHRVSRRTSMLTGIALMPMAMLIAHSTPVMGCTLKNLPTGVCMMMTCGRRGGCTNKHACV